MTTATTTTLHPYRPFGSNVLFLLVTTMGFTCAWALNDAFMSTWSLIFPDYLPGRVLAAWVYVVVVFSLTVGIFYLFKHRMYESVK
jgi:hypothetical protein